MTPQLNAYLEFIGHAIMLARYACQRDDPRLAEAILDAIHNLPSFLQGRGGEVFEREFRALYLEPLVARYPELDELAALCPS